MSKGFIVWFTGLSGSGKSTLANLLQAELTLRGHEVEVFDGDEVRKNLSKGLGFSKEDRDTHVRRVGYVAGLVARYGGVAIVAAISPYQSLRDEIRKQQVNFIEVYVHCSLKKLIRRDVKGLYAKAIRGEISNFTGISDPYEVPLQPEVVVNSEIQSPEQSLDAILHVLENRGLTSLASTRLLSETGVSLVKATCDRLPVIEIDSRIMSDAYMLACGAFAPMYGFVGEQDYRSILESGRLSKGAPFTIPITLRIHDYQLSGIHNSERIALHIEGRPVAVVEIKSIFAASQQEEALAVYGTDNKAHPGVSILYSQGRWAVEGEVIVLEKPTSAFPKYDLTPEQVRLRKQELGWQTMVGFQTRNPIHRAHEYLHKVALEFLDGLLLHPLVGDTKNDDIPAEIRMRCYKQLLSYYYPSSRTLLVANPAWMRYAGPKEAVFHAIIRRNFGCTHFIVGRDHAGVGNYYDTYAAHNIFDKYTQEELGIQILRFEHAFYCHACNQMASSRTCPHSTKHHSSLSGTKVRELLAKRQPLPPEFTRPEISQILLENSSEESPS